MSSRDISDNEQNSPQNEFLHNMISNRVRDLSNNPRVQFINYLISAIDNEFNDNLSVLPMANRFMSGSAGLSNQAAMNQLLNRTLLQEKDAYKKVLSEKGEEQLKEVIYQKENFDTDQCVISMEDFNDGDTVTQLPCGHIFHPESIKTWLKEESSKCPVCRYELKFDEIKKDFPIHRRRTTSASTDISGNDLSNNSITSNANSISSLTSLSHLLSTPRTPNTNPYNRMFNNMDFLYNPTNSINRPRRRNLISQRDIVNRILRVNNYMDEDSQMQNAIMASIYETSSINTDLNTAVNTPIGSTNINEIIENNTEDTEETMDRDSDEENLLASMTLNETMLQDIDSDDDLF